MKKILLTSLVFSLIHSSAILAQSSESEIEKAFYMSDQYISIVLNYMPKGWSFNAVGDKFILTSPDTVWVLEENRNNAPVEKKEDLIKRIKESGIRVIPEIVIRYEDKWTPDKIQQSLIQNAAIDNEIAGLPEKYNITQLFDKKLSSKNHTVYTATNEKEKGLIVQFEKEKSSLLAKKVILPDFHTQKYSLFLISSQGKNDDMHVVYPDRPSLELYTIISTFREVCGK